jgi:hypothetical protein
LALSLATAAALSIRLGSGSGIGEDIGMLTSAMTTRRVNAGAGNHENIFGAPGFVLSRAIARLLAASRHAPLQAIDLQDISPLPTRRHLASLSRSGVFRARMRTRSWRDRDVQQPTSFVWSPTRPANRLCLRRRSPILALSIWSGCWRDRLHGTSFKLKQTTGCETASRSKEVAS